jgi:hypothetical protein
VRLLYTLQYATASSSSAFLLRRSYTIDPGTGDTIIPARVEFPLDYDRRHNLTAIVQGLAPGAFGPRVLGVRPFAAWEGSLVLRFLSGLPYTPLAAPPDTLLGPPNEARLPWTGTVDMLVRRPIVLGRVRTGLYLDVRNLFNRENIVAVRRDTGSPFATTEIIEQMAEEAYAANPYVFRSNPPATARRPTSTGTAASRAAASCSRCTSRPRATCRSRCSSTGRRGWCGSASR